MSCICGPPHKYFCFPKTNNFSYVSNLALKFMYVYSLYSNIFLIFIIYGKTLKILPLSYL